MKTNASIFVSNFLFQKVAVPDELMWPKSEEEDDKSKKEKASSSSGEETSDYNPEKESDSDKKPPAKKKSKKNTSAADSKPGNETGVALDSGTTGKSSEVALTKLVAVATETAAAVAKTATPTSPAIPKVIQTTTDQSAGDSVANSQVTNEPTEPNDAQQEADKDDSAMSPNPPAAKVRISSLFV